MIDTMSKYDAVYTAGLIDGEGTVTLTRRRVGANRYPSIGVTSTSRELIDYLHSTWGGTIVNQKRYQNHHKQAWIWAVHSDRALEVLRLVSPHMKEDRKRQRANLILNSYKSVTVRNGKYSSEQLIAKQAFEKEFFLIGGGGGGLHSPSSER